MLLHCFILFPPLTLQTYGNLFCIVSEGYKLNLNDATEKEIDKQLFICFAYFMSHQSSKNYTQSIYSHLKLTCEFVH